MPNGAKRFYGWKPSPPDQRDFKFATPSRLMAAMPSCNDCSQPALPAPFEPAFNQGAIGSCGPNSASGDILYDLLRRGILSQIPSRLFIYWFTRFIMGTVGQDSGVDIRSMLKALARFGWCDESLYPYNVDAFTAKPSQEAVDQAAQRRIVKYQSVPQASEQMRGCLAGGDPFIYGFTVYESFEAVGRSGMVPMPSMQERPVGGHAILAVGYNDGPGVQLGIPPQHYKMRNSWGPEWGQNGYCYMPYSYAHNPNLSGDFWTVQHAEWPSPDPVPPTPPVPPVPPSPDRITVVIPRAGTYQLTLLQGNGTMLTQLPATLPMEDVHYLFTQVVGGTDKRQLIASAWGVAGYGLTFVVPNKGEAMMSIASSGAYSTVAKTMLQELVDQDRAGTHAAAAFDWSALVAILLALIEQWRHK